MLVRDGNFLRPTSDCLICRTIAHSHIGDSDICTHCKSVAPGFGLDTDGWSRSGTLPRTSLAKSRSDSCLTLDSRHKSNCHLGGTSMMQTTTR